MRDLDEVILSFQEVVNYKVYIKDENTILIELFILNTDNFCKLSQKIMDSIINIPVVKEGVNKEIIRIILEYSKEPILIKNSMVKRKIYDYR